jgi:sarcosine oxidase subunit alpha
MTRLAPIAGEWIDRARTVSFEFEGRRYAGLQGDTISSALLANGVQVLGRSFKYHRPRGVLSAANHDVNALYQWGERANVRGDAEPLVDAMRLEAVNTFGGVQSDRAKILDRFGALFPVGFYYKAFYRPRRLFPFWERLFRRAAGLGRIDFSTTRIRTPKRYDFCDVLVIGAGPSGLSAAIAAASAGARVVVVDENARAGGSLGYQRAGADAAPALLQELTARAARLPGLEIRCATFAAGYYDDHWVPLIDARRMTKMRARAVIVASGVYEQPAVFRGNDLPGVMLASAAQRLIYRYAVRPARRAVILTANADGYAAALDLLANGGDIVAVVDLRAEQDTSAAAASVEKRGVRVIRGTCVYEATGRDRVGAAIACPLLGSGEPDALRAETLACDGVLLSVGYAPALALLSQAGVSLSYDEALAQFVPEKLPPGVFTAGRVNGVYALEDRVRDGERAGKEAARHLGLDAPASEPVARAAGGVNHRYPVFGHPKGKNFVDFDEDLTLADFHNAAQEGFDSIELLKRYSTVGMGPSQGKHSNLNAIRILAKVLGKSPGEIGATTARPFYHPVPMALLAGRGFHPHRETPLHVRHAGAGAVFMQAGVWLRPEYYAAGRRSKADAVREEARAVREAAGLIDVGTLGKIEVRGPDAAAFLERVYTGRFGNLKVGMTRYALMVDEAGVIIDDGVVARLDEQHFYFTTTTTGSASVYRELTRLNTLWRMQVAIANLTGHFGAMNLAGPKSREVFARLTSIDLSAGAFPYLGARMGEVAGVPARVLRVGFVGELGYEIHVPADSACHVWDAIQEAGRGRGLRLFGVEAQRLLRLEKGHIIIGQDTDGLTTPFEAGLEWAVKMDKAFFVGKRSLQIVQKKRRRHTLAGFTLAQPADATMPKESQLIIRDGRIAGRVTSVAFSAAVGKYLGLAFVAPELSAVGTRFFVRADGGRMLEGQIAPVPFYDPAAERQRLAA